MLFNLEINESVFLKNPEHTDLGKRIVSDGLQMIYDLGFEAFTFKKLSIKIQSTEASIYRYFENKHKFLLYLSMLHWAWMSFMIDYETNNIENTEERLRRALMVITHSSKTSIEMPGIDSQKLQVVISTESDKTYLTRQVDADNESGLFSGYKSLCGKIAEMVQELNPEYQYPRALISTALEAANQQIFFAKHLPSLTDIENTTTAYDQNYTFLSTLIFKAIGL